MVSTGNGNGFHSGPNSTFRQGNADEQGPHPKIAHAHHPAMWVHSSKRPVEGTTRSESNVDSTETHKSKSSTEINILSNNDNDAMWKSGNDNGYHSGAGSTYEAVASYKGSSRESSRVHNVSQTETESGTLEGQESSLGEEAQQQHKDPTTANKHPSLSHQHPSLANRERVVSQRSAHPTATNATGASQHPAKKVDHPHPHPKSSNSTKAVHHGAHHRRRDGALGNQLHGHVSHGSSDNSKPISKDHPHNHPLGTSHPYIGKDKRPQHPQHPHPAASQSKKPRGQPWRLRSANHPTEDPDSRAHGSKHDPAQHPHPSADEGGHKSLSTLHPRAHADGKQQKQRFFQAERPVLAAI